MADPLKFLFVFIALVGAIIVGSVEVQRLDAGKHSVAVAVPKAAPVKAVLKTCRVEGDSIAYGTGHYPGDENSPNTKPRLPCVTDAKIGISSAAVIARAGDADEVVISAGSNDPDNPKLEANLETIRAKAHGHVRWIVPINAKAALAVMAVAAKHGDATTVFKSGRQSGCARCDNIHPHSYLPIVIDVLNDMGL